MKPAQWNQKNARINLWCPPPGPPSKSEVRVYEKFVRALMGKPNARILILGSTPELRDICNKHKITCVCVDYNKENFYILRKKLKYPGREKLIIADWRMMKLREKYDLILGDVAFAMIPFKDWDKLFISLRRFLKDQGLIVQRAWMRKTGHFKNMIEYLKKFHAGRRKIMEPFTSLGIPFASYYYDEKNEQVYYYKNLPDFKKFVKQGLLRAEDYRQIELIWKNYLIPTAYPLKPKFESKIKKYYIIKKTLKGKDWFKNYAPIYVLGKR